MALALVCQEIEFVETIQYIIRKKSDTLPRGVNTIAFQKTRPPPKSIPIYSKYFQKYLELMAAGFYPILAFHSSCSGLVCCILF